MSGMWRRFLQMFGEGGGDGGAGGADGGAAGAEGAAAQAPGTKAGTPQARPGSLADVVYGRQDDDAGTETDDGSREEGQPEAAKPQSKPSFDELLKDPEYKAEFQKRFDKQFNRRFAEQKAQSEQQKKLAPAMNLLANKYGTAAGDIDALLEAILGDNELIERQAYDRGMEPDAYREYNRVMAENQMLKQAEAERQKQERDAQFYLKVKQQAEQAKQIYPGLDLKQEAQNPLFNQLLANNIPVATAYQVVHLNELTSQLVQRTAQEVKTNTVKALQAQGNRPRENGAMKTKAATIRSDPTKLTRGDFDEIIKRTSRGEPIRY